MNDTEPTAAGCSRGASRTGRARCRIGLLNPNSSAATTALLKGIAEDYCPSSVIVVGHTMARGPRIITDEAALDAAAEQVVAAGIALASGGVSGLIVSAFGDPGLFDLRERVDVPVVGIAEAGMAEAVAGGRKFSIITTTPDLEDAIRRKVTLYGHDGNLASLRVSGGDAVEIMSDPVRMQDALIAIARECVADGAEALLIGGGPLAPAAAAVSQTILLPVINPVAAGTRQILGQLGQTAIRPATSWDGGPLQVRSVLQRFP